MAERTCRSMEKVSNGKHPMAWLLLQPHLVVVLLSRNLRKTCMMELVPRVLDRAVVDDMAEVTTIEIEAMALTMLAFFFG